MVVMRLLVCVKNAIRLLNLPVLVDYYNPEGGQVELLSCTYGVKSLSYGVILDCADQTTEDIYNGTDSKAARRIPQTIWKIAIRKLDMLNAASDLRDLRVPPANRLEALKGKWSGFHSLRINDQFRIVFRWLNGNAKDVQITDYH